jgi:hypothetical protein
MIIFLVKSLISLLLVFLIKASDLVKQLRMMDFDDYGPRTQVLMIIGILHGYTMPIRNNGNLFTDEISS